MRTLRNTARVSPLACLIGAAWIPIGAFASDTVLVSINTQGTASSGTVAIADATVSDDGRYVAFRSNSGLLAAGGSGGLSQFHVYLRDLLLGQTIQVSPAQIAALPYQFPVISADGSTVVFETANSVLPIDTNGVVDVYAYDVASTQIECVSVDGLGIPGGGRIFAEGQGASRGVLSSDGNFIAFQSSAALDPADTNVLTDVYVRDRSLAYTRLESVTALGNSGNGASIGPVLSATSEYLVFSTAASDLVGAPTSGIYRKHRLTGAMQRVDVNGANQGFSGAVVRNYALSGDGQHVAITVLGTNLAFGDSTGYSDVFVSDLPTQTISRVSTALDGGATNGNSREPEISFDGRYVSFVCEGTNVVANDLTGSGFGGSDVVMRDRLTGRNMLVSVSDTLTQGSLASGSQFAFDQSMTSDGRYFALQTYQRLEPTVDTQFSPDVYLRDRIGFASFSSGKPGGTGLPTLTGSGSVAAGGSGTITIGNAAPSALGLLFVSLQNSATKPTTGPFSGFTLVTQSPFVAIPIALSASGGLSLPYTLPDVPFVPEIDLQALLTDGAVVGGVAATNGIQMAF